MRRTVIAASLVSLALLPACSSDPTSAPGIDETPAADVVAAELEAMAASAELAGDEMMGAPYRDAAEVVRLADRVSIITVVIDGNRSSFLAVGTNVVFAQNANCGFSALVLPIGLPGAIDCVRLLSRPALVAWERENPRRILIVNGPLGPIHFGSRLVAMRGSPASAILIEGRDKLWLATSGVAESRVNATLGPCGFSPRLPAGATADCTRVEFGWEMNADFEPAPRMRPAPGATGTPHLEMERQRVFGVLLDVKTLPTPPPFGLLEPSLQVSPMENAVLLRFSVTNRSNVPLAVLFNDGQRYDFVVRDGASGRAIWRWSDDKAFIQALGRENVGAGESLHYSETWRPGTVRGRVLLEARLTSSSHPVRIVAPLELP